MQAASPRALLSRVWKQHSWQWTWSQDWVNRSRPRLGEGWDVALKHEGNPARNGKLWVTNFSHYGRIILKMLYYSYHEVVILNLCVFLGHWKKHHMVLCSLYIPSKLLIIWFMFMDVYGETVCVTSDLPALCDLPAQFSFFTCGSMRTLLSSSQNFL